MSDNPDLWATLRALEGVHDKLLKHPAFDRLPDELEDGETPECVAWNSKKAVYIATNRRIVHFKTNFMETSINQVMSYLYSDIRFFRADTGFASLGCNMTMVSGGAKTLPMKPETRQRFADVVRSHLSAHQVTATAPHPAASTPSSTPPSETPPPPARSNSGKGVWLGCGGIVAVLVVVVALIATMCSFGGGSPSEERLEERRKGFHCLSAWDGNHDGIETLVRARLNDPGSMETHRTVIGPVVNGQHRIKLDFSAANAFGGMVRSTAIGYVDHDTCRATLDYIE